MMEQSKRMRERLGIHGLLHFSAFPAEYSAEIMREIQQMPLEARLHAAMHVYTVENIVTTNGHVQILVMVGNSGSTSPFAQYLGIGNGPIAAVTPSDTSISGEVYRAAWSASTAFTPTIDIQFTIPSGSAITTFTSVGIWGNGASSSPGGAGTLHTHALANYSKGNFQVIADYLLTLE